MTFYQFRSEQERKRSSSQNESTNKSSLQQLFRGDESSKKENFFSGFLHSSLNLEALNVSVSGRVRLDTAKC